MIDLHTSDIIGSCCHCDKNVYTVIPIESGKAITSIRLLIDPANQKFNVRDFKLCEGSGGVCDGNEVSVTFGGSSGEKLFGVTKKIVNIFFFDLSN